MFAVQAPYTSPLVYAAVALFGLPASSTLTLAPVVASSQLHVHEYSPLQAMALPAVARSSQDGLDSLRPYQVPV